MGPSVWGQGSRGSMYPEGQREHSHFLPRSKPQFPHLSVPCPEHPYAYTPAQGLGLP